MSFNASWNVVKAYPCNGCISLIGFFNTECIVIACMLNAATPIGASMSSWFPWSGVSLLSAFHIQAFK